jgi:hypothetical protein
MRTLSGGLYSNMSHVFMPVCVCHSQLKMLWDNLAPTANVTQSNYRHKLVRVWLLLGCLYARVTRKNAHTLGDVRNMNTGAWDSCIYTFAKASPSQYIKRHSSGTPTIRSLVAQVSISTDVDVSAEFVEDTTDSACLHTLHNLLQLPFDGPKCKSAATAACHLLAEAVALSEASSLSSSSSSSSGASGIIEDLHASEAHEQVWTALVSLRLQLCRAYSHQSWFATNVGTLDIAYDVGVCTAATLAGVLMDLPLPAAHFGANWHDALLTDHTEDAEGSLMRAQWVCRHAVNPWSFAPPHKQCCALGQGMESPGNTMRLLHGVLAQATSAFSPAIRDGQGPRAGSTATPFDVAAAVVMVCDTATHLIDAYRNDVTVAQSGSDAKRPLVTAVQRILGEGRSGAASTMPCVKHVLEFAGQMHTLLTTALDGYHEVCVCVCGWVSVLSMLICECVFVLFTC